MCSAYMQWELNISSTYRFMLSVSYIKELDNSSLCDTRLASHLLLCIAYYALRELGLVIPPSCNAYM